MADKGLVKYFDVLRAEKLWQPRSDGVGSRHYRMRASDLYYDELERGPSWKVSVWACGFFTAIGPLLHAPPPKEG
jgi:hypothetical protein